MQVCQGCHNDGSNGIKATVWEGTLHDKWIVNCSACHEIHVDSDPVLDRRQQADVCFRCHLDKKDTHPEVGNRVPDFSRMGCAGCHRVHRLPKTE